MDVVIVEDERLSAEILKSMVEKSDSRINVIAVLDSLHNAKDWFRDNSPPDLLLLDIQLGDGTGFDLLKYIKQCPPVIFTTAYDEYAIKAFKYNSIDYLLKPIGEPELISALQKFKAADRLITDTIQENYQELKKIITKEYKKRCLIKMGDQFKTIMVEEIAYAFYDEGMTYLSCIGNIGKLPIDYSLDQLEDILNPMHFFRINRKYLISLPAIKQIHSYFNSRLLLQLDHQYEDEIIVSRDRVKDFKRWIDC